MFKRVGTIQVHESGKLVVSDPCYTLGTWCQAVLENVKPGMYSCEVEHEENSSRVKSVRIAHMDHKNISPGNFEPYDIGVDSGTAGFLPFEDFKGRGPDDESEDWYMRVTDPAINEPMSCGITENCFVSSSGYGDGGYRLFSGKSEDEIVSLELKFIEEDEVNDY